LRFEFCDLKIIKHLSILLILAGIASTTSAQIDPREAKVYFNNGNYAAALRVYKNLLKKKPIDADYNHKAGLCYLRSNIDKSKAIPYLEKVVKLSKFDGEVLYDIAMAYQYDNRFDDAIKMYDKYKAAASGKNLDKVDRQIETCHSAKELIKHPVNVTFENIGPTINSKYPDYYPFVAKDESFIVYTTRRGGVMEFDGFYSSDVWVSTKVNGVFSKAKNAGYDEQAVGLSDDARTLFVYLDHIKEYGDIYTSIRTRKMFEKIEKMGENVNSGSLETSASISADRNTLFFASARAGGSGGRDLYMTRKLPNGEWASPQNLGTKINTQYNEDFPTLSADGKTLYFCSEGHASMGGYDIFVSTWDPETNTWSAPKNIGYPLNTAEDNRTISFSEDGTHAYVSALRKDGRGDLDIYRVSFNKVIEEKFTVLIRLQIHSGDSLNPYILDALVAVENMKNNELVGEYTPNPKNGFYTIAVMQPGNYVLSIDADGYELYNEEIILREEDVYPPVMTKIVKLTPN